MELIFGAGKLDRRVRNVEDILREYRDKERDWGLLYLDYEPVTPRDRLFVEDLAVTMLINSRVAASAATSVYANGATLDLGSLPRNAWPEKHSLAESIKAVSRINEALDWITEDLTRPENASVWPQLQAIEPTRSRIDLFDMIWWMYFRQVEPVAPAPSS